MRKTIGKRQTREMSPETRQKISQSLKAYFGLNGVSPATRQRMSDAQRKVWANTPKKQEAASIWGSENNQSKDNKNVKKEKGEI